MQANRGVEVFMVREDREYIIVQTVEGLKRGIMCRKCAHTSFNENDIINRYCGACKKFHAGTGYPSDVLEPTQRSKDY